MYRKVYFILLPITFLLTAAYSLGLSNYYTSMVVLAPEFGEQALLERSFATIAKAIGMKNGDEKQDKISLTPPLYPDLMNSVDFYISLFPIKVTVPESSEKITYYEYLINYQKKPWWNMIMGDNMEAIDSTLNPFKLTPQQDKVVNVIKNNIKCEVTDKSYIITIEVTDQNPVIAACLADSIKERLQESITAYRVKKAKIDLAYYQEIVKQTKSRYDQVSQQLATFADSNNDASSQVIKSQIDDMTKKMNREKENYYTQLGNKLNAEMKIQTSIPAFTTLKCSSVPLEKSGPVRSYICLGSVLVMFLIISIWVFFKEDDWNLILGEP